MNRKQQLFPILQHNKSQLEFKYTRGYILRSTFNVNVLYFCKHGYTKFNFGMIYLVVCKIYTDVGGIK